jgi:hypothetical protein
MSRTKLGALGLVVGASLASLIIGLWPVVAQTAGGNAREASAGAAGAPLSGDRGTKPVLVSVSVALGKPFTFAYRKGTTLEGLADHLRRALDAPVVLDVAALDRLGIGPDANVRLELSGARLETGLKLLLDQVGMTYRVIPEDNLLLFTDHPDGDDNARQAVAELKVLHREIHELREAMEEILDIIAPEEKGPTTKKPTIIEELPSGKSKPGDAPKRSRDG